MSRNEQIILMSYLMPRLLPSVTQDVQWSEKAVMCKYMKRGVPLGSGMGVNLPRYSLVGPVALMQEHRVRTDMREQPADSINIVYIISTKRMARSSFIIGPDAMKGSINSGSVREF
jgi:hypothetical protein